MQQSDESDYVIVLTMLTHVKTWLQFVQLAAVRPCECVPWLYTKHLLKWHDLGYKHAGYILKVQKRPVAWEVQAHALNKLICQLLIVRVIEKAMR